MYPTNPAHADRTLATYDQEGNYGRAFRSTGKLVIDAPRWLICVHVAARRWYRLAVPIRSVCLALPVHILAR
jgi:hypothetical protein